MSHLKLQNLLLLFLSLGRFFIAGRSVKKIEKPKKVLIIQLAKMGDMVCTTPMFRAIKQKYPDCKVYVLGDAVNRELLQENRDIDYYFVWQKKIFKIIKQFKKEQIDFGCVTGPSPEALAILYLAGIPAISAPAIENGFSPQETRVYKLLRKLVIKMSHRMGNYASREYLRLLEPIGIFSQDSTKHLGFSERAFERTKLFFSKENINPESDFVVGIFPSTGYTIKKWPADRFAKVADYIFEKYQAKIIVPGTGEDKKAIDEMLANLNPKTKAINCCDRFTLDELKALISQMSLFISVDTGPIYIAEAFGIPTIDIVGPMDDMEQAPRGKFHKVVKIERKEPQMRVMNTSVFDYKEAIRQRDNITVEMVIKAIDSYQSRIQ